MEKLKKLIIPLFFIILLAVGVCGYIIDNASFSTYSNYGNLMNEWITGNEFYQSFTAFGSNRANAYTTINSSVYEKCDITPSTLNPLIKTENLNTIGGRAILIWVVSTSNQINIYNPDCELIQTIEPVDTIVSAPVYLASGDYSSIPKAGGLFNNPVIFASNQTIYIYEFNEALYQYDMVYNVTSPKLITYMTCDEHGELGDCYIFTYLSANITIFDINAGTFSYKAGINGTNPVYDTADIKKKDYPITYINQNSNPPYSRLAFCSLNGDGTRCHILDENLNKVFSTERDVSGITGAGNPHDVSAFTAKLGNNFRVFTSMNYHAKDDMIGKARIYDVSTNTKYLELTGGSSTTYADYKYISNWAVADWDKDGDNDACILTKTNFSCYDSTYTKIYTQNFTGLITSPGNIYLANFVPQSDYLAIATTEGIYAYEGGEYIKWWDSGITTPDVDFGLVSGSGNRYPFYVYTDDDNAYIARISNISIICGDDICSIGFENELSCIEDCFMYILNDTTGSTYEDGEAPIGTYVGLGDSEECESGYSEYGKCSLAPGGHTCLLNSDCLSNECVNNVCNSAGAWSGIDNFISLSFGADETSLTFISIFIIIGLTIGIIFVSKGNLAGIIAGVGVMFISTIFFMIVGWLPVFFVVALVLVVIIIVALLLILRG